MVRTGTWLEQVYGKNRYMVRTDVTWYMARTWYKVHGNDMWYMVGTCGIW